jgi:exodeoxyribonuclease-3
MLKIISWNVNSVNSRLERAIKLMERHQPDVLCLQELKCTEDKFPFEPFQKLGYECAIFGQKTYNGVAVLSREKPLEVFRNFEDGIEDPQARFLCCRFDKFSVASVYVPNGQAVGTPSYDYKLAWLSRLRTFLDHRFTAKDRVVLGGDFNVALENRDVHDPEAWRGGILFSEPEIAAVKRVMEFGLTDTFRMHHAESGVYSWWDYRQLAFPLNRGLRIDYLFASPAMAERCIATGIDKAERKGEKPSDHAPCIAEFLSS